MVSLSCLAGAIIIGSAIYSMSLSIRNTTERVDPFLIAARPSLEHATEVMASARRASTIVERLVNHSVEVADASVPTVRNAARMLNETTILMQRMSRIAKHPSLHLVVDTDLE
jgi:hypothetical protein